MKWLHPLLLASSLAFVACNEDTTDNQDAAAEPKWTPIFDGKSLDGWTPKFAKHPLGENLHNVFRVEDGLLTVNYADWPGEFAGEFGHLFYQDEYSHYRLRAEYRFIGEQVAGGEGWAVRNNGFMIHGEKPEEMEVKQSFPRSLEVQLLGGLSDGKERPTGNLCTPETHVIHKGELIKQHVTNSASETYDGDQWVTIEVEVRGSDVIRHFINGEQVMEYSKPQLHDGTLVDRGTISIQAETAPIQFRSIEVMELD